MLNKIKYLNPMAYDLRQRDTPSKIPNTIHMIWVGDKEPPDFFFNNLNTWKSLMPHWNFMCWTNDKLTEEFIEIDYLNLIHSIKPGVQKADVLRYYIMKRYGGFYMDSDITPRRSIEDLLYVDNDMIICNDIPINWAFISIGFFASVPNHPVFENICKDIFNVNFNSNEYHLTTGPGLFGRHILSFDWGSKFPAVLRPESFYTPINREHIEFLFLLKLLRELEENGDPNEDFEKHLIKRNYLESVSHDLLIKIQKYQITDVYSLVPILSFGVHEYAGNWS